MSLVLYSFRVFLLAAAVAGVNKTTLEELEETTGNLRKAWIELSESSRVSVFIYLQPILLQIYLENLRA
jgi:flagellin-specific chaperone FliS